MAFLFIPPGIFHLVPSLGSKLIPERKENAAMYAKSPLHLRFNQSGYTFRYRLPQGRAI
jgi:hypothetical protein